MPGSRAFETALVSGLFSYSIVKVSSWAVITRCQTAELPALFQHRRKLKPDWNMLYVFLAVFLAYTLFSEKSITRWLICFICTPLSTKPIIFSKYCSWVLLQNKQSVVLWQRDMQNLRKMCFLTTYKYHPKRICHYFSYIYFSAPPYVWTSRREFSQSFSPPQITLI